MLVMGGKAGKERRLALDELSFELGIVGRFSKLRLPGGACGGINPWMGNRGLGLHLLLPLVNPVSPG